MHKFLHLKNRQLSTVNCRKRSTPSTVFLPVLSEHPPDELLVLVKLKTVNGFELNCTSIYRQCKTLTALTPLMFESCVI